MSRRPEADEAAADAGVNLMCPGSPFPTFLDLFSGCGGFTLGMLRAGFTCLGAVDFNPEAVKCLRANLAAVEAKGLPPVQHVLERDLSRFHPSEMSDLINGARVDVIVGGPPCQGFSLARMRDGSNHGSRLKYDPRRHLFRDFLRYVEHFKPKVFVMENVLGMRTAAGGEYFTAVQAEARALGYRVHGQVEDAWELGVPQKRRRQLIVGTLHELPAYFIPRLAPPPRAIPRVTLWDAIGDLPILAAGEGEDERPCDVGRRIRHVEHQGGVAWQYLTEVYEVDLAEFLYNHVARPHSLRDLGDFEKLHEGETSAVAMRDRGVRFDFPYDKTTFKDRYTRQGRRQPCSTVVAHMSKDGLMFIHPTQVRSLTPREAARVQTFPDWFRFPKARTHAFRLIGNAVPPVVSEAVGHAVKAFIQSVQAKPKSVHVGCRSIPCDARQAVEWLLPLMDMDRRALRGIPDAIFTRAWHSVAFLYAGLHPDSALEHGNRLAHDDEFHPLLGGIDPRLTTPYFEQSGWPVALAPLAKEAWRRYGIGVIREEDFYCSEARFAGASHCGAANSCEAQSRRMAKAFP